jgi:hypothetical protein
MKIEKILRKTGRHAGGEGDKQIDRYIGFEVLTMLTIKGTVLWAEMPCS